MNRIPAIAGWHRSLRVALAAALATTLVLTGCATNPVTGKRELSLISQQQEIAIGEQHYLPTQQAQGGQYVLDPELTAYVQRVGERIAAVSDRPDLPYEFVVLASSVPNAWALPGGKIAINRGLLLELDNEAELAAVLGHEIVHSAARHGAQNMERGMLLQTGVLVLGSATREHALGGLAVGGAQVGAAMISSRYGRQAELEADRHGIRYMAAAGYDPAAAVSLQETFVRLSEGREPNWLEGLFASHPPSRERVEANRATAARLPRGLRLGREEYQARIAGIRANKAAYDLLDEGRRALAKNDPAKAQELAERAIALEPREALFYGLKADSLFARKRYAEAREWYDQAIRRNDAFFQFHLQRGLARQALGDHAGARADLERSNQLFPTAIAHEALGRQALARGDRTAAQQHFATAGSANDETGRRARIELARLELAQRPDRYLAAGTTKDRRGRIVLTVQNRAEIDVRAVVVQLVRTDAAGRALQQQRIELPGTIAARSSAQFPLTMEGADPRRLHAHVIAAKTVN